MKLGWAAGSRARLPGQPRGADRQGYARLRLPVRVGARGGGSPPPASTAACSGRCRPPPSPTLTRTFRAAAGIVISASHNPYWDNGLKFFSTDGSKLPDETEARDRGDDAEKPMTTVDSADLGRARRVEDASGRYIEFCKSTFPSGLLLGGMKIVVDSANGAAYQIAREVFDELGADVVLGRGGAQRAEHQQGLRGDGAGQPPRPRAARARRRRHRARRRRGTGSSWSITAARSSTATRSCTCSPAPRHLGGHADGRGRRHADDQLSRSSTRSTAWGCRSGARGVGDRFVLELSARGGVGSSAGRTRGTSSASTRSRRATRSSPLSPCSPS